MRVSKLSRGVPSLLLAHLHRLPYRTQHGILWIPKEKGSSWNIEKNHNELMRKETKINKTPSSGEMLRCDMQNDR